MKDMPWPATQIRERDRFVPRCGMSIHCTSNQAQETSSFNGREKEIRSGCSYMWLLLVSNHHSSNQATSFLKLPAPMERKLDQVAPSSEQHSWGGGVNNVQYWSYTCQYHVARFTQVHTAWVLATPTLQPHPTQHQLSSAEMSISAQLSRNELSLLQFTISAQLSRNFSNWADCNALYLCSAEQLALSWAELSRGCGCSAQRSTDCAGTDSGL